MEVNSRFGKIGVTGFEEYVDGFGDAIGSAQVYYFSTREDLGGYGLWAIGRLAQPSILQTNWVRRRLKIYRSKSERKTELDKKPYV